MKVFVIFGTIEFIDGDAYVRKTHSSGFVDEQTIEALAMRDDCDYITPHYYNGQITFMQYHTEK